MRQLLHPLAEVMVIAAPCFVTDRHPAKAHGFTRPPFAHLVVIHQMCNDVTLGGRPHTNGMVRLVLLQHNEAAKTKEVSMPQRNMLHSAAVYGIDIGKNIFHVVGLGSDGVPIQKVRFRRDTLLQFLERAAPAIVGMESCAASQWITKKIQALGHKVRLIPGQFVKPYVDIIDAEAIAEAALDQQCGLLHSRVKNTPIFRLCTGCCETR